MTEKSRHDTYGLLGHPLGHSFSQKYFTEKFAREGINAEYMNFDIPPEIPLSKGIDMILRHGIRGFNVTIPYKESIIPILDAVDPTARQIGAVNVVKCSGSSDNGHRLTGFNTDYIGFSRSFAPHLRSYDKHALVLGSGGASRAVCFALRQLSIGYTIVSRTPRSGCLGYGDLSTQIMERNTIIINCTPLGTYPDVETCPAIPYNLLSSQHLCYDLVYNPSETLFMRKAAHHGAVTVNGAGMLTIQAEEAWNIWNQNQL